ncbi:hypothetical protein EAF04_004553 [Stromatinia cepivora]|nr:hypothetical protein EAF04_004553 [Stromatinia cepivora]
MRLHQAHLQCSLCFYSSNEIEWTRLYCVVLRTEDQDINLTSATYISDSHASYCTTTFSYGCSEPSLRREIQVRCQRSNIGDFNAFLLHDVCLQTLQAMLKLEIPSGALFSFCQALANDYQKQDSRLRSDMFRHLARFDVSSPGFETLAASENIPNLNDNRHESKLDKLPLDVIWLILPYLDSKSLISYFASSSLAFSLAALYPPWKLLSYTESISKKKTIVQDIVISAHYKFDIDDYIALDKLVSWIQKLDDLACILKVRLSYLSSFEVPLRPINVSHSEQRFLSGYQ